MTAAVLGGSTWNGDIKMKRTAIPKQPVEVYVKTFNRSFTMPRAEYAIISEDETYVRLNWNGVVVKLKKEEVDIQERN